MYFDSLKSIALALGASTEDVNEAMVIVDLIKLIAKAHGASDNDLKDVVTVTQGLNAISNAITNAITNDNRVTGDEEE